MMFSIDTDVFINALYDMPCEKAVNSILNKNSYFTTFFLNGDTLTLLTKISAKAYLLSRMIETEDPKNLISHKHMTELKEIRGQVYKILILYKDDKNKFKSVIDMLLSNIMFMTQMHNRADIYPSSEKEAKNILCSINIKSKIENLSGIKEADLKNLALSYHYGIAVKHNNIIFVSEDKTDIINEVNKKRIEKEFEILEVNSVSEYNIKHI